ncbi:transcriptional repressor LexA [Candidatus Poribacteria bacterium]|nr:transcriptional repressor LexA [Candidatus Poribacteria bacterium]
MRKQLTKRQQEILDYIKIYIQTAGYPPTVRDIGRAFKISEKGAYDHLRAVERKGYIRRAFKKNRAIEVLDFIPLHREEIVEVPIVGRIAAGEPLLATQNIEGTLPLSKEMVGEERFFALRVKGTSMIEAGIFNDDYVIVKQQSSAEQGDIVVALLDDEATVKRFYRDNNYIRLQPENPAMNPIIVKEATILGKVVGLFRRFN